MSLRRSLLANYERTMGELIEQPLNDEENQILNLGHLNWKREKST